VGKVQCDLSAVKSKCDAGYSMTVFYEAKVAEEAPYTGTPSGTVSFADNDFPLFGCDAVKLKQGLALCKATYTTPLSSTTAPTHTIVATYTGNDVGSTSPSYVEYLGGNVYTNPSWSGYGQETPIQGESPSYTGVSAEWTVPTAHPAVTCSLDLCAKASTWISVGGTHSKQLIQIGTEEFVNGSNLPSYDTFWEAEDGSNSPDCSFGPVAAGDKIEATKLSPNEWCMSR
jgi:hypothetical protein